MEIENEDDDRAEIDALRAHLATMGGRAAARSGPVRTEPEAPFEALPPLAPAARAAIDAAALEANDSYLTTFLEPGSFCPFSRGGRNRGQTARVVHYADTTSVEPLLAQMVSAAAEREKAVIQVILPLIEVEPAAFSRFCHALTAAGNARLRQDLGEDADVFAVAPLHPELPYASHNPYALIPLLRRTPDPTIQWVRLDALDALYSGRTSDTLFVDPGELASFLARPRRTPLFERIAESNLKMARRLGVPEVERSLRALARQARERYTRILLGETPAQVGEEASARPTVGKLELVTDTSAPRPPLFRRDGRWALARASELLPRVPIRVLAAEVELVLIRSGDDVHVLHARCPHRHAPLTDALVEADRLVCPHHGWDFQLASGRSEGVPGASVAVFRVTIAEDAVWVEEAELRRWRDATVAPFRSDDDVL